MSFEYRLGTMTAIALLLCVAGCGSSSDSGGGGGSSMDQMAAQMDAQEAAKKQEEAQLAAQKKAEEEAAAKAAAEAPPERMIVGHRPVEPGGGYYSAIIGARRHILNVVDSLSWIQGVRNFKAEKGRKPKDTAEFMKDVVNIYQLQLPRLEEGQEYLYDPNGESAGDFGQLYVIEKPPAANGTQDTATNDAATSK